MKEDVLRVLYKIIFMKFHLEEIKIESLIKKHEEEKLDLNPPYQRNEVWSTPAKKLLIQSITQNFPIPNFFIRVMNNNAWEMVDGQQRSRAIIGFYKKNFPLVRTDFYDIEMFPHFLSYKLAVIFITELNEEESIQEFYARVNSTGMKLNKPELRKAKYFETRFLNLLEEIAGDDKLVSLDLFTESTLNRMNDIEFISELTAQLVFGLTDKKDAVEELFTKDISEIQYIELKNKFNSLLEIFLKLNSIFPINKTRYKQKNDFYTLFGFIYKLESTQEIINYFYKLLVLIDGDITPSNDECEPLQEYAFNCVSQSNSKAARISRYNFFSELLANKTEILNDTQIKILNYYELNLDDFKKLNGFITLDIYKLQNAVVEPRIL